MSITDLDYEDLSPAKFDEILPTIVAENTVDGRTSWKGVRAEMLLWGFRSNPHTGNVLTVDSLRNITRRSDGRLVDKTEDDRREESLRKAGAWHDSTLYDTWDTNIIIIPDLHSPFMVEDYMDFIYHVHKTYEIKRAICIGDIIDGERINFHGSSVDSVPFDRELEDAIKKLAPLYEFYPKVPLVMGNHDLLPYRQATNAGMSEKVVLPFGDLIKAPEGWSFHKEIILDGHIKIVHKAGSGRGKNSALKHLKETFMSTIAGHTHTVGRVDVATTQRDEYVFSCQTGCLIDAEAYGMAYAKDWSHNNAMGCPVLAHGQIHYVDYHWWKRGKKTFGYG